MRTIAHPTDLSEEAVPAFAQALRLAVEYRCRLDVMHVRSHDDRTHWHDFPHVREFLVRWGLLPPGASIADIHAKLGVDVRKVDIRDGDAIDGIVRFMETHPADLVALSTHGKSGLTRWLMGSVSEDLAHALAVPTLFFGPEARPFVDLETGRLAIDEIAVPVAREPSPSRTIGQLRQLLDPIKPRLHLFHVGDDAPRVADDHGMHLPVEIIEGRVVETILRAALRADLIAMPTAGRHGFLDALRGSTTEQVLRRASRPVLALPA